MGQANLLLLLLAGLVVLAHRRQDPFGEACLAGAFTVLLLPLAAVGTALVAGRLHRAWWGVILLAYCFAACSLDWLRGASRSAPEWAWWLQESKLFELVVLGVACAAAARGTPGAEERLGLCATAARCGGSGADPAR